MKRLTLPALALTALFAPADAVRAGTTDAHPVMEIVSFRLVEGSDETAFLTAAKGTEAMLRARIVPGRAAC